MSINAPVSLGELVDKITILNIKLDHIEDEEKRTNIFRERDALIAIYNSDTCAVVPDDLRVDLELTNRSIWGIEDKIRVKEREQEFDWEFIELARSVYITNDERFRLKTEINKLDADGFREEKSYNQCVSF